MKEKESLDPDHGSEQESSLELVARDPQAGAEENESRGFAEGPGYLFRGDDTYKGGPLGLPLGSEAALEADIQSPADHVLRRESGKSSIFTSFTEKVMVARRFGGGRQAVLKVAVQALRELEGQGRLRLLYPQDVYLMLKAAVRKTAKDAAATRDAMKRNAEVLIQGQIPAELLQPAK